MIDDDGQIGIALGQGGDDAEVARKDQGVEAQAQFHHGGQGGVEFGAQYPVVLAQALQHRPQSFELRLAAEIADAFDRLGRGHVRPADDALDQRRHLRHLQQPQGVGFGGLRLHQHRAVHALRRGGQVGGHEIATDSGEIRRRPTLVVTADLPQMLMRIDDQWAALMSTVVFSFGDIRP